MTSLYSSESRANWYTPKRPGMEMPNIILVILDDVGFAQLGCYGGLIDTPNIDALAKNGLRFNNFHTCGLCTPTRASLLTGRNPHAVGCGTVTEDPSGFPGYSGRIPRSTPTIANCLKSLGYNSIAIGKWHNTPEDETSPIGPYDRWPLGLGFDQFYGFIGPATDQWTPNLIQDNHIIGRPDKLPYHLSDDLVDQAISHVRTNASIGRESRFFIWLAFGACHSPHQAPEPYIAKYRGCFNSGWDSVRIKIYERQIALGIIPANTTLTPGNAEIPAWKELTEAQRDSAARSHEVFAGFLEHTDHAIGRLVNCLKTVGILDDTLLILLSDNGASAEGGIFGTDNDMRRMNKRQAGDVLQISDLSDQRPGGHYPAGWAQAGNTPFRWFKRQVHFGGVKDPLIIHWPSRISDPGSIRSQFCHAIDIMPTILAAANDNSHDTSLECNDLALDGISMLPAIENAQCPSRRSTQYFECQGNRGIIHNGWSAVIFHGLYPWRNERTGLTFVEEDRELTGWELYDLNSDFSQAHNLARSEEGRLREMVTRWWVEAARNSVLPLNDQTPSERRRLKPSVVEHQDEFTYWGHVIVSGPYIPDIRDRTHEIEIDVIYDGKDGVLLTMGGRTGGYCIYVDAGKVVYCYNYFGQKYRIRSVSGLRNEKNNIRLSVERQSKNTARAHIMINDIEDMESEIFPTIPIVYSWGQRLEIGDCKGMFADDEFSGTMKFSGCVQKVYIKIAGTPQIFGADDEDAVLNVQ